jgi:hypothetical protein
MTFDPPFYAVSSLAGIERSGSPILQPRPVWVLRRRRLTAGARFSAAEQNTRKQIDGAR